MPSSHDGQERGLMNGDDEKRKERPQWGNQYEFLLSCVGLAVGLGNIWRFPWLVQKNGGGVFLIPYFIMLFLAGIPLFFLEVSLGQRNKLGPIPVWNKVSKYTGGIGCSQVVVSYLSSLYYNIIIAWCIYYLFSSFQSPLPWASCPKVNISGIVQPNPDCEKIGTTSYHWYYEALQIGVDLDDRSGMNWKITLCLLAAWLIVFLCMIKGIQSVGKVVYVTAVFPYVGLTIFLIKGVTLEGASDGLIHLFKPEWSKLAAPSVWMEAAAQIFFSLSVASGNMIAFASYNPIHQNTFRDTLIVCFTNCGTSLYAGVAIFSILGFRANNLFKQCLLDANLTSSSINVSATCDKETFLSQNADGTGLAFVALTEAINQMPGSIFWSILLFLMLVTLGLDSMFGGLEGCVTSIKDIKFTGRLPVQVIILVITVTGFLFGLPLASYSGEYIQQVFNSFSVDFPLIILALSELIGISYFYGVNRFCDDIEYMIGKRPWFIMKLLWMIISPVLILVILSSTTVHLVSKRPTYTLWDRKLLTTRDEPYPDWALMIAALLTLLSLGMIPIGIGIGLYKKKKKSGKLFITMNDVTS